MAEEKIKLKIESKVDGLSVKPEDISSPDLARENKSEKEKTLEGEKDNSNLVSELGLENNNKSSQSTKVSNDVGTKKLENILEKDLKDVYLKMSPNQRISFKKRGEEVSKKINVLMGEVKIKTKKILALIRDWLGMIPGVNKFFLEQLAKNKLDEIMNLKKK